MTMRRRTLVIASAAGAALPLAGFAQAALEPVSLDGYVIPQDLSVKPPRAGLGTAPAALSGWWKSVNVPKMFELELLLIFEDFKSPTEAQLVVAIKSRRGKPGRTERVIATVSGDQIDFVRLRLAAPAARVTLTWDR